MTEAAPGQGSWMRREIDEIPAAAARLAEGPAQAALRSLGAALRERDPACVITVARGSSDHAATCLHYAVALVAGVPVASIGPSVASVYAAPLRLERAAALAISQSGASEDLVRAVRGVVGGGGLALALTNTPASPLARAADRVQDVMAGPERAVAATKSYTNSVLAGLWILAHWTQDVALLAALERMAADLADALERESAALAHALCDCARLVVLGRGPTLGIAQEVALKAMEVCGIPAVAYSSAEVLHGPSAILRNGYPVLGISGGAEDGLVQTLDRLAAQGAHVLPSEISRTRHRAIPALESLMVLYRALEAVSRMRGLNPDKPETLQKITSTV